ncbi:GNAT family N-acetyltransferase [Thalassomonas actiniarum]|uniref:GNAT family N-acetyltransferase n=2 Tax=Thalassomonas actiniarum TaxID=485447 RepID=A0AAE9YYJ8_9GAMM|nr:GNAT family N-acetyltransferase [Thalassomonas actiniarum]
MPAMLNIQKISNLKEINGLKQQYFAQSTAPLDGMWHFGFAPMSAHFGFYENEKLVGYCCINSEGYLLQFYLAPTANIEIKELFTLIIQGNSSAIGEIKGAFVSTAEPQYLSLCLDTSPSFKVNALMYEQNKSIVFTPHERIEMTLAQQEQLDEFVEFAIAAIGAPKEWLTSYYGNLIKRKELWGYWQNDKMVATGECRLFDEFQCGYADLGMIVAQSERGKGFATSILSFLSEHAESKGLKAICSTESGNIAAQKP